MEPLQKQQNLTSADVGESSRAKSRRPKISGRLYLLISQYPGGLPCSRTTFRELQGETQWSFVTITAEAMQSHYLLNEENSSRYATSDLTKMREWAGVEGLIRLGTVKHMEAFIQVLINVRVKRGIKSKDGRGWYGQAVADLLKENKERKKEGKSEIVNMQGWHLDLLNMGSKLGAGCIIQ